MIDSAYANLKKDFERAGIAEEQYQWYGLVIGMLVKGADPAGRLFTKTIADLLNDSQPLPGSVVALLTNMALDVKEKLKNRDNKLFIFPSAEINGAQRLKELGELAYGLSLGITVNAQTGTLENIKNKEMLEDLHALSEISNVDPLEPLSEDDLDAVLGYLKEVCLKYFKPE